MEEWYRDKACDGFNIVAPYLPGGLEGIVDLLVPELQRRGLFRTEYEGTTLRDSLGLPRPVNRFFASGAAAAESMKPTSERSDESGVGTECVSTGRSRWTR